MAEEKMTMEKVMEDYALKPVPPAYRNTRLSYLAVLGIPQAMIYFAVGSLSVAMAGLWLGLTASIIAGIGATIIYTVFAYLSHRQGYSYDMLVRLYGWGHKGSLLPSVASTFALTAFWVLEAYWIAKALEAAWPIPLWIYYIPLTIFFIVVPLYGYRMIGWFGMVTFPVGVLLTLWAIFYVYAIQGVTFAQAGEVMAKPLFPGGFWGALDWSLMGIGLWAVAAGDLGRFCGSRRAALASGPMIGALSHVVFAGLGILLVFPVIAIMTPVVGAEQAGMSAFDVSVPFVVVAGWVGVIVVLTYQTSVQYMNVYNASINLSSIFASLLNFQPGRFWWVLVANALGFIFLVGGAAGQMVAVASFLAVILGVIAFISIADWLYRRWGGYSEEFVMEKVRQVNPMAFVTFVVAVGVSIFLWMAKIVPSASIIGYPLGFLLYLGLSAATRGRYQRMVGEEAA